jgi:ribonuclease T1
VFLAGRPLEWQSVRKLGLAITYAVAVVSAGGVFARGPQAAADVVVVADLPKEAQTTERLIRAGGPFRYSKDGAVFGNRERALPRQPRGFYREYTVTTPGSRDRGARRIVCGGLAPTNPETCYYTDDHYASFRRIAQ